MLERVVVSRSQLLITAAGSGGTADIDGTPAEIRIAWSTTAKDSAAAVESEDAPDGAHNNGLVQSVVRAHAWAQSLRDGTYESVEMLAEANRLHPKGHSPGPSAGVPFAECYIGDFGRQPAGGPLAGTNPKAPSVALD